MEYPLTDEARADDARREAEPATTRNALALPGDAGTLAKMENLLGLAVEHGANVEVLERLLTMRQTLREEAATEAFYEALSGFQSECPTIAKSKTATVKNQQGIIQYTYRYAPLEDIVAQVQPILRRHGLSYRFDTRFEADPPAQVVTCIVHHTAGHSEISSFRTPVDQGARMNDMQKSASAQTYAKRYALCNALGILTGDEDNDGRTPAQDGSPRRAPVASAHGSARVGDRPAGGDSVPAPVGQGVRIPNAVRTSPNPMVRAGQVIPSGVAQRPSGEEAPHPAEPPASAEDKDRKEGLQAECLELAIRIEAKERESRGQATPETMTFDFLKGPARGRIDSWVNRYREGRNFGTATQDDLETMLRVLNHRWATLEKGEASDG